MDTGEVIILSDDDDEDEVCEIDVSCNESSVCIVEPEDVKKTGNIWILLYVPACVCYDIVL